MCKLQKNYCKNICKKYLLALLLLFCNFKCLALELGPLESYSYLDEPFSAEIEILDFADINLYKTKIILQSKEDLKLQCDLEIVKNRAFLHIWSAVYINRSFLEFSINISDKKHNVTKSYTLLLDPAPEYMVNRQLNYERLQQELLTEKQAKIAQENKRKLEQQQKKQRTKKNIKEKNLSSTITLEYLLIIACIVIISIACICLLFFMFNKKSNKKLENNNQEANVESKHSKKIAGNDDKMLKIKLKLARQYIALDDTESAKNLLQAIVQEGSEELKQQALEELGKL